MSEDNRENVTEVEPTEMETPAPTPSSEGLDLAEDAPIQQGLGLPVAEAEVHDCSEAGHDHADAKDGFDSSARATDQVLFVYDRVRQGLADLPDNNLFEINNDVVLGLTKMSMDQTIINDQNDVLAERMRLQELELAQRQEAMSLAAANQGLLGRGGSPFQ